MEIVPLKDEIYGTKTKEHCFSHICNISNCSSVAATTPSAKHKCREWACLRGSVSSERSHDGRSEVA